MRKHIKSFPAVESHYCWTDTAREYFLEENLNMQKMYKLYKNWLVEINIEIAAASLSTYRRIFNHHSGNIGFNKLKKTYVNDVRNF